MSLNEHRLSREESVGKIVFSLRDLSALCVFAVNLPEKPAHRRGAENTENAQSSFSDRLLQRGDAMFIPGVAIKRYRFHFDRGSRELAPSGGGGPLRSRDEDRVQSLRDTRQGDSSTPMRG